MGKIKLRCKMKDGMTEVKSLITHPMETGRRKDKETGEKIPAHFIQKVIIESKGKTLLECNWGASISKNPYVLFTYKGAKDDKIKLTWTDNKEETGSKEATVK